MLTRVQHGIVALLPADPTTLLFMSLGRHLFSEVHYLWVVGHYFQFPSTPLPAVVDCHRGIECNIVLDADLFEALAV